MVLRGETEVLEVKPGPVPLCPPQKSHCPSRDRTQASALRGWQLTA